MSMTPLALAERIIQAADRAHPADALLRQQLKAAPHLAAVDATRVSEAVFAYFRWRGWLATNRPIRNQIERAIALADQFAQQPQSFSDTELSGRAVPDWVRQEFEVTGAWVRAVQAEPLLWLRARPGQGGALVKKLGQCRPFGSGHLADIVRYDGHADLFLTKEFHAGEFELQDISSQAVAFICAPQADQTWWDACAGEGGKLLHFADLMRNKGLIWASDRSGWRLQKLRRRAARAKVFNYRIVQWNGGASLPTKTKFDGVLVDAPCSGIGTWQRNPHARWTTTLQDVHELSRLQQQLLKHASTAVKPGGKLIYAACTLTRSETLGVVDVFESTCREFRPLPFHNPLVPESAPEPHLLLRPEKFGGNGMFLAAWRRQ